MDGMNFLNKKYTSVHNISALSQSRSRSSRTFLPSHHYTQQIHGSAHRQSSTLVSGINQTLPTLVPLPSQSHNPTIANHCSIHPQQLIRHLCLDCIELLCSQCIAEHISIHRQNNTFPNIHTLKQLKTDMNIKLQQILQYMFKQKNHPKNMANTIDSIRKESLQKIQNLGKWLMQHVQQWIMRLKASVINSVGYEQIKLLQSQMYSLHQQVNQLINSLSATNVSVHDIKKAYQIDADRLQKTYKQMLDKYVSLSDAMRVEIDLDGGRFVQGLEQAITMKIGVKTNGDSKVIKVDEDDSDDFIGNIQGIKENGKDEQEVNLPLQMNNKNMENQQNQQRQQPIQISSDVPLLYCLVSGTETLKIIDPSQTKTQIQSYQLQGASCFPLNSTCLLVDGMIVISGGMIAQNKKSHIIQIFDYLQGRLVTQSSLSKGRSSHRTIAHQDKIFFIGGFTSQNEQCKQIQILKVDGIQTSPHKCKWGGPNLCIKTGNQILKITVSGVQSMNLDTHKWMEVSTDVPFALSKGMQIASYANNLNQQQIIIFGDDQSYYKWDLNKMFFTKCETNVTRPVISSTTKDNQVYGWVEDNKLNIVKFDGEKLKAIFNN